MKNSSDALLYLIYTILITTHTHSRIP